jgi:hypothetical protein
VIPGQTDFDFVLSRRDQQGLAGTFEFGYVTDEDAIHKHRRSIWFHFQLNLGGDCRQGHPGVFFHLYPNSLLFSGANRNVLHEIQISTLLYGNVVFARKQQEFFRSLQFVEVADVLTIDPDAGSVFNF